MNSGVKSIVQVIAPARHFRVQFYIMIPLRVRAERAHVLQRDAQKGSTM